MADVKIKRIGEMNEDVRLAPWNQFHGQQLQIWRQLFDNLATLAEIALHGQPGNPLKDMVHGNPEELIQSAFRSLQEAIAAADKEDNQRLEAEASSEALAIIEDASLVANSNPVHTELRRLVKESAERVDFRRENARWMTGIPSWIADGSEEEKRVHREQQEKDAAFWGASNDLLRILRLHELLADYNLYIRTQKDGQESYQIVSPEDLNASIALSSDGGKLYGRDGISLDKISILSDVRFGEATLSDLSVGMFYEVLDRFLDTQKLEHIGAQMRVAFSHLLLPEHPHTRGVEERRRLRPAAGNEQVR